MTSTPDYTTPLMQVRLLIADLVTTSQVLTDEQITGYLGLEGEVVKLAAADALDAIASSEALVSKVIKSQDLSTDGPKTAEALRKHAASLREQVDEDDEGYFDIVDFDPYPSPPELAEG